MDPVPPDITMTITATAFLCQYPLFAHYSLCDKIWAMRDFAKGQHLDPERTVVWCEGLPPAETLTFAQYPSGAWGEQEGDTY